MSGRTHTTITTTTPSHLVSTKRQGRTGRRTIAALGCAALIVASATPAFAAAPGTSYVAHSAASAVDVTVFGSPIGTFAGTTATAGQAPKVIAQGFGLRPQGDATKDLGKSLAEVAASGTALRDPAAPDARSCDVPGLPEALAALGGAVSLAQVCSDASSSVDADGTPGAVANATGGAVTVNGKALADVIISLVLDPILEQLSGASALTDNAVVGQLEAALETVCNELPDGTSPRSLVDQAASLGVPVLDVVRSLPGGDDLIDRLSDDCVLSLRALDDLMDIVPAVDQDALTDAVLAALDRDFLTLALGTSSSSVSSAETLTSGATAQGLAVSTPSLAFLIDAIVNELAKQVDNAVDEVTAIVPIDLSPALEAVPPVADIVKMILDLLPLDLLIDDEPLLSVAVAESSAIAKMSASGAAADTTGSHAGSITVRISPAIATLLGIPAQTVVAAGQTQVIAEGTPLESKIIAGDLESLTTDATDDAPASSGARVVGGRVELLTEVNDGIIVGLASAEATAGALTTVEGQRGGPTTLPRTGTDAKTALGMVILAAGLALTSLRRAARPIA